VLKCYRSTATCAEVNAVTRGANALRRGTGCTFELRSAGGHRDVTGYAGAGLRDCATSGPSIGDHATKEGKQKSGKTGTAKSRKQAIAIGLSKARKKGAKVPAKKKG
jgi:hypothetical protein